MTRAYGGEAAQTVTYNYTPTSMLKSEYGNAGSASNPLVSKNYGFDAMGNRFQSRDMASKVQVDSAYNGLNQLTGQTASDFSGTAPVVLSQTSYGYDGDGNTTSAFTQSSGGASSQAGYVYDDLSRLVSVTVAGVSRSEFGYDGLNRLRVSINYKWDAGTNGWGPPEEKRRIYDGMEIVQERDNNSKLTASVTRGGNIGGILARTTPGLSETTTPTQEATLDGAMMARSTSRVRPVSLSLERGDSRGDSARLQSAVWSDESSRNEPSRAKVRLVALATVSQSMTTSFYAYDMQGNVTTLTDTAGNVVGSYAYDAWGNVVASSGARAGENPYRFSTKEQLGGLYHFGYRFYDAGTGRWLNRDPLEENGGINLYGFNHNNPIKYLDPDGACPQAALAVIGALGGALIGGGMAWYRGEDIGRGAFRGAVIGGIAGLTGGMAGGAVSGLVGEGFLGGAAAGALGGAAGDAVGQAAEIGLGWRCSYDWKQTAMSGALGGLTGGLSSAKIACFVRGTQVTMADGTTKSIEQVKVGDSVQSRDEATGKTEAKKVTRTFERQVEATLVLRFSNGEKVETTREHPFYVEGRGFVPAGEMGIGTSIVTRAGPSVKLVRIET